MRRSRRSRIRGTSTAPTAAPSATPAADPRTKQLNDDFQALVDGDRLAFYPDWPAPGFYDAQVSSVQKVITGQIGAHEALTELADYYKENTASIRVCERLGMEHLGETDRYYGVRVELFRARAEKEPPMNADERRWIELGATTAPRDVRKVSRDGPIVRSSWDTGRRARDRIR